MDILELKAKKREVRGKKVKYLRREGKVPAVIYGRHLEAIPIELNAREVSHILPRLTSSSLLVIDLEGEKHTTLIRERQHDVIKGDILHLDFQALSMKEKLRTAVSLELVGETPLITEKLAELVRGVEELEVECLPQDLPERILVDISSLEKIGDEIFVRDLQVPEGVEVLTSQDEMVVLVVPVAIAAEEEEEIVEEVVVGEEPEVIEKGKAEEEEGE